VRTGPVSTCPKFQTTGYGRIGDAEFSGGVVGFGNAGLAAVGDGRGGATSTDRVGEGSGSVADFLLLEFSFALSLALRFTPPMSVGESPAKGEAEVFALIFELAA